MNARQIIEEAVEGRKAPLTMEESGWLDRSGNFYPLGGYNNHNRWSMYFHGKSVEQLQAAGWLRVVPVPMRGTLHVEGPTVSPSQRRVLGALADDNPDVTVYHTVIGSRRMNALFGEKPDLAFHQ